MALAPGPAGSAWPRRKHAPRAPGRAALTRADADAAQEGITDELAELKESEEVKAAQKALADATAVIDARA